MQCIVETSLYEFINGKAAVIDTDLGIGLLEILVEGHGRFVVADTEVRRFSVPANELPY